jgi:putative ABC transport system substrate-binding protein
MKRLAVAVVTLALLTAPALAEAQQPAKVVRVGFLGPSTAAASSHLVEAFRQGLRDLGYVEGQNIAIEYRWAEGTFDRLAGLAGELAALEVDVLVAPTPPAVRAAKSATTRIPIVMLNVGDPVGLGLVASLERPGGNVTGQTNDSPELGGKLIEFARNMVPGLKVLAVLRNPANPAAPLQLKEVQLPGQTAGLRLVPVETRMPSEFEAAFDAMRREGAEAVIVRADPMFFAPRQRLAELCVASRLPAIFERREYAEAGGLLAYGPSLRGQFDRAATFVDKILKGAKPADLPVEQPTKFELVINMMTAKALGLTIPPSILARADELIQ